MESLIIFVHVIAAIGITGLVLMQHGKGADMGASFGSGASQTMFGSVGSGNALTKSTAWLATVFFVTSLTLALFARQQAGASIEDDGLIENTGILNEAPAAAAAGDLPVAEESVVSDIPQGTTPEQSAQDAPVIDEALQDAPAEEPAQ
jgi:preprotein translocase subunit SecG